MLAPKAPLYEKERSGNTLESSSGSSDDSRGDKKFGREVDDLNMSKSINIEWIADEL